MYKNGKIRTWYSWPVIIIMLCVFWPVGLFLLLKRLTFNSRTAMCVGILLSILGGCAYAFAALGFIVCLSEGITSDDFVLLFFFAVFGFIFCWCGREARKESKMVKQYLTIIGDGQVRQLEIIAVAAGKPYKVVRTELQKMIRRGYFGNAFINEGTRELVLTDLTPATSDVPAVSASSNTECIPEQASSAKAATQPVGRMVICPCCGANNTIYGPSGECEYCGSQLK